MADPKKPILIVINNAVNIVTASDDVRANIGGIQDRAVRDLSELARENGLEFNGYVSKGTDLTDTGTKAPRIREDRFVDPTGNSIWENLRNVLKDKKYKADDLRLVVATPMTLASKTPSEAETWVREYIGKSKGRVTISTLVVADPATRSENVDKKFINPVPVRVGATGFALNFASDSRSEDASLIKPFMSDEILAPMFPEGTIKAVKRTTAPPATTPPPVSTSPDRPTDTGRADETSAERRAKLKNALKGYWEKSMKDVRDGGLTVDTAVNYSMSALDREIARSNAERRNFNYLEALPDLQPLRDSSVAGIRERGEAIRAQLGVYGRFFREEGVMDLIRDIKAATPAGSIVPPKGEFLPRTGPDSVPMKTPRSTERGPGD